MANKGNKRTIYLGLDYTNFTGGVTEVSRKMQLLDADFKLAQQQAQNYGNETDKLGVKHDYLRTKIELQTKKVEAAEKAHKEATETNKKSQREIDALAKKVLQEKASLEKLTGQLKETEDAQDELNDTTRSFGDEIRELADNLGISVNPMVEKLASNFDGVSSKIGNAIVSVGTVGAVAASIIVPLVKCTTETAEWADELTTLSKTTGISTTELQKFKYAGEQIGVSVDALSDGLKEITNKMHDAANGSSDTSSMFRKLHVSIKDSRGQLKDANEVFFETIDALGKIRNHTQRDAIAMELFGESARNLNPLIEMGSEKLRELGIEAEELGIVMGESSVEKFDKLHDAMAKFSETSDALKRSLGEALLPILTGIFDVISSIPAPVMQTIAVVTAIIAVIVMVSKAIMSVTGAMAGLTAATGAFSIAGLKILGIILAVVAGLIALGTVIAVIMNKKNDMDSAMEGATKQMSSMTQTVNGVQKNTYSAQQHASGTTNFRGGRTWVGEAGPELLELPPGSRITPQAQAGTTEYNTFYITIDAKNVDDFNKVVELAKRQRIAQRRMA